MPTREPSIIKEGGYQGSSDPGRPTTLMQQQIRPMQPAQSNGASPSLPSPSDGSSDT